MNEQLNLFSLPPQGADPPPVFNGQRAKPDLPVEDRWPPGRLTPEALRAYKRAEYEGLIRVEKITIYRATQAARVTYLSTIPDRWIREALGAYKREYQEG